MLNFETLQSSSEISTSSSRKITSFSKNYITSEGAIFHNVLYYMYEQLSIPHYQGFAINYFE